MFSLVVITEFLSMLPGILRHVGDFITDAQEIEAVLTNHPLSVVKVAATVTHAPEPVEQEPTEASHAPAEEHNPDGIQ